MDPGAWLIVAAVVAGLFTAFVLRTRAPAPLVAGILAAVGGAVGWGGLLLQDDPSPLEVWLTIGALVFLVPAHVRIVLGPFGRRRAPGLDG